MKRFLKACGILVGAFVIILIILFFVANNFLNSGSFLGSFAKAKPFPAPTDPKEITLKCDYRGESVVVNETLYQSYYDYYKNDTKKVNAFRKSDHSYLIDSNEKDGTIKEITQKIQAIGASKGLGNDEVLDLAACMVQNIPYDQPKADIILSGAGTNADRIPRRPYETLYDYKEVCTGKTYLGAAIAKELGYGFAVLTFDKEKHMMLGVGVPAGYGSFGTEYGGLELTGVGFKVGTVSELSNSGSAVNKIQKQSADNVQTTSSKTLGTPSSTKSIASGTIYQRITQRQAINEKIDSLWTQLTQEKPGVENENTKVAAANQKQEAAKSVYMSTKSEEDYQNYKDAYGVYESVYGNYNAFISGYNDLVSSYNTTVEQYNNF